MMIEKNKIIKIPWYITLMDSMIIFNNPVQKYIKRQMDKQPEVPGEDEYIRSISSESDIMPSCKSYEEWMMNKIGFPGFKDYYLDNACDINGNLIDIGMLDYNLERYNLIKESSTDESRKEYKEYIVEYRKELRDWYFKKHEKYVMEHPGSDNLINPDDVDENKSNWINLI